jgi:N-formylglutamate amidohydrolase
LRRYYDPYHQSLSRVGPRVPLGVDCHTMSPIGPTLGPDPGRRRPAVCLSDAFGTCPGEWVSFLARELQEALGEPVALNRPFKGGHIIRSHACETAWIQVEFSRTCYTTNQKKSRALLRALSGLSKRWG